MRFRPVLAVMLALLWAPVTSHCLLEQLPGFEFLTCCTHDAEECSDKEKDCETDACAVVEQGSYKLQDNGDLVPKPSLNTASFFFLMPDEAGLAQTSHNRARAAPPPLSLESAWQFSSGAAPLPRAPSHLL